jgi:signal transduction histidine kinase
MAPATFSDFWRGAARHLPSRRLAGAPQKPRSAEARWRRRILLGAVVLVLIQIAFVSYVLKRSHDVALDEATEHVKGAVRNAEADTLRSATAIEGLLRSLPALINLTPRDDPMTKPKLIAALAAQSATIRELALFDADGVLIVSSAPAARRDFSHLPEWFRLRLENDAPFGVQVAAPWRDPKTGDSLALFGKQLASNSWGARFAVIAATPPALSDQFSRASSHFGLHISLLGAGGEPLASELDPPPDPNRRTVNPARLATQKGGVWIGESPLMAEPAVNGIAALMDQNLLIVASIGTSDALANWRTDLAIGLLVTLTVTAMIVTFAILLSTLLRQRSNAERALTEAKEAAEAASRAKSSFLANMSHELRTPLNAIIGFSELIRDRAYGDDEVARYSAYAGDIYQSGEHLLGLINDILDLSKVEAGAFHAVIEDIDIDSLLIGSLSLFEHDAANKRVQLFPPAPCGVTLRSDFHALQHIFSNLLSNAVKFTSAGGVVGLTAIRAGENGVRISVSDTGVGIEAKALSLLFEPFQQGNAMVSRRYGGSGLGLSIVRSYAQLLGATVSIESALGQGTTVTVEIPSAPV